MGKNRIATPAARSLVRNDKKPDEPQTGKKQKREELERDMLAMLPEEPRKGLIEWALESWLDNLGGELTIFSRESYAPEDWVDWGWPDMEPQSGKRRWAAACDCTACGERYFTAWGNDIHGRPAMAFRQGDDGLLYDGWFDTGAPDSFTAGFTEGDYLECPHCGANTRAVHASSLRAGRTFACQFGSVERVGDYGALLYWLIRRRVDAFGCWEVEIWPRSALVIDGEGKPHRFGHTLIGQFGESRLERWERRCDARDPEQIRYYSHGNGYGQTARNTCGAVWWDDIPDLTGSTAEKTGLAEYVREDGSYPALYLGIWRNHRNAENLVKAGFTRILSSAIENQAETAHAYNAWLKSADPPELRWNEARPSRMLAMSREQMRRVVKMRWGFEEAEVWVQESGRALRGVEPEEFGRWVRAYGSRGVGQLLGIQDEGGPSVGTALRYLDRQGGLVPSNSTRVQLLVDYWRMLREQLQGREPTRDQLFPPRLITAHDRVAEEKRRKGNPKLREKFAATATMYAPLAWSDGDICIVIPQREEDLIREGEVLHHCVGGYGRSHTEDKPIFFVRHARRPERSWFTLNEDLREILPQRIQLHGYRNELYESRARREGGRNKIPQRVLDFVARWEREILAPWQRERMMAQKTTETQKKKGEKAA